MRPLSSAVENPHPRPLTTLLSRLIPAFLALVFLAGGSVSWAGTLEQDAAAFKARLSAETSDSLYNEHKSLDLDKDLAALELRAKDNPAVLADLMALRAKVVPDFYRPEATKNPALFKEMRWSEFVALRDAADEGTHPLIFHAAQAAYAAGDDSPDFVSTDPSQAGRRLTTAEIVALWKKIQAAEQSSPEAVGADMAAMKALLERVGRRIGSKKPEDQETAAKELSLLFENMNQADVREMSRKDPEMLRDLLSGMTKLRDNADPAVQKWLHQEGAVERFDKKLFELKSDPDMSQIHALMRGLKPPPGLEPKTGAGPDDAGPSWWDSFTTAGEARIQRDDMLKEQVGLALRLLWKGEGGAQGFSNLPPGFQKMIEAGDRLADPLSRESWLVEARRLLAGTKDAQEMSSLLKAIAAKADKFDEMSPEEAAEDPDAKALSDFRDKHREFMETYSMMKGMSAQYSIWMRDNLAALPDGTRVDSRTLGIHPDTLPHFDPSQGWLVKRTRDIGGTTLVGLEYTTKWNYKDGRGSVTMTQFWTSETGPGGVTVPVSYTLDPQGVVKQRRIFMEKAEGGFAAVTEEGEFDETGRLAKGKIRAESQQTFEIVDSKNEETDLGNGRIRRIRWFYDKANADAGGNIRNHRRIVELFDKKDRRLLARKVAEVDPKSGKDTRRNSVFLNDKGEVVDLETASLDAEGKVIRGDEWFISRFKPTGWIYDPETGESYHTRDPSQAEQIDRIVGKLQEYAPRWINRITRQVEDPSGKKSRIQKTLLVGEVKGMAEAEEAEEGGSAGSAPVLVGPALFKVETGLDDQERPITFQLELDPLKGLPREARLEVLKDFVGQVKRALQRYQPQVIAIGFWGGDDVAQNPEALVAFLDQVVDQGERMGLDPVVVLDAQDNTKAPYLVSFVDKDRKPVQRYYASYREFSGYGPSPWGSGRGKSRSVPHGLTVFGIAGDGSRGSIPLRHIVSPTEEYLPRYQMKQDNKVFGTDWSQVEVNLAAGSPALYLIGVKWDVDLNTLLGARQFERLDFVQCTTDKDGRSPKTGDVVIGDWKLTREGSTILGMTWEAVDKAGETVVAFAGVAAGAVMYAGAAVNDFVATTMEDRIGSALELATDPGVAKRYKEQLEEQRVFRVAFKDNLLKSVVTNATMNPLVASWRHLGMSDEAIALEMKKHGEHYIFEAPNVMAKKAVGSDSWAEKAFWGGASAFTNFGLQTGKGLAVYGPLGNIGAPRAWVVNGVPKVGPVWSTAGGVPRVVMGQLTAPQSALASMWHTGFQTTMGALGIYGAAESTIGEGGIIDAAVHLYSKGGPDAELAFYQSLNNFTAATVPYFAGLMGSRRKGGPQKIQEKPAAPPQELVARAALAEKVLKTGVSEAQMKALSQAHEVGLGQTGKNGEPATVGNYTTAQILRKARILKQAGFTPEQVRRLMENEVVGVQPPTAGGPPPGKGPPPGELASKNDPGKPGTTRVVKIAGRESNEFIGVDLKEPAMVKDLPADAKGRREFHITVVTPPEFAQLMRPENFSKLSPRLQEMLRSGAFDIEGAPKGGRMIKSDVDGTPAFQMEVDWPEAQRLRESLGLGKKNLHVSLNGGLSDVFANRAVMAALEKKAATDPEAAAALAKMRKEVAVLKEPAKDKPALPEPGTKVVKDETVPDFSAREEAAAQQARDALGLGKDAKVKAKLVSDPKALFVETYVIEVDGQVAAAYKVFKNNQKGPADILSKLAEGKTPAESGIASGGEASVVGVFKLGGKGDVAVLLEPTHPEVVRQRVERRKAAKAKGDVKEYSKAVMDEAPFYERDVLALKVNEQRYGDRLTDVDALYKRVNEGMEKLPEGTTIKRLKWAVEGHPTLKEADGSPMRIPLNFASPEQYLLFRRDVANALRAAGVTDATIQMVGSSTKGWKGNPNKELASWKPTSDCDIAVFSEQSVKEAMRLGTPANKKVVMNGEFSIFKNDSKTTIDGVETGTQVGFDGTELGRRLKAVAKIWDGIIYEPRGVKEGFDFKLSVGLEPFTGGNQGGAITVSSPKK